MRKYNYAIILIFSLLLLNILWFNIFQKVNQELKKQTIQYNSDLSTLKDDINLREKQIKFCFSGEIKNQLTKAIINAGLPRKVDCCFYIGFYFSKTFCEPCFLPIIQDLASLKIEQDFKDVLYFSNKTENFKNIDTSDFINSPIALGEIPFLKENNIDVLLFTLDSNLQIEDVYYPRLFPEFQQFFFQQLKLRMKIMND